MRRLAFALIVAVLAACAVVRPGENERTGVTRQSLGAPTLVTTIGTPTPAVSDPGVTSRNALFARVGAGKVVFFGTDNAHGNELWTTDGTPAGTTLVRDIYPSWQSSVPNAVNWQFAVTGSGIGIFFANDGSHGTEAWRTDGTTAGTYMLADLLPGLDALSNPIAKRVGNDVYISAANLLYKTDGTVAGTVKVGTMTATNMVDANGTLFFQYNSAVYKSDGTPAGTVRACPACATFFITDMEAVGNKVFYSSGDFGKAGDLWVTDGTPANTLKLQSWTQSGANEMTSAGGKLFFRAYANNAPGGNSGLELWTSDGTVAGTKFVYAVSYSTQDSTVILNGMVAVGSNVFFLGEEQTSGIELWFSDGTAANTRFVKDIMPGFPSGLKLSPGPTPFGNGVLFAADDGTTGVEPWYSDGTDVGTVQLKDITAGAKKGSNPESFFSDGPTAYFQANNGLWKTTGPTGATTEVLPASKTLNAPVAAAPIGDRLFFAVDDGVSGIKPWITDGTPGGTSKISDLGIGPLSGYTTTAINYNGLVYFDAYNPGRGGLTLWRSDGTALGTTIVSSATLQSPDRFAIVNGRLFFTGGGIGLQQPWIFTEAGGAVQLSTINNAHDPFAYHGETFFFASSGLVKTDGTAVGTAGVASVFTALSSPVLFHDRVYFAGNNASGTELWSTDGTTAGTGIAVDVLTTGDAGVQNLTVVGDILFFTAFDASGTPGAHGNELWRTDGTVLGTSRVKDIFPGVKSSNPHRLVASGGKLLFYADDGTGMKVFVSDGTDVGTVPITDALPATSERFGGFVAEPRLWATLPGAPILFPAAKNNGAEWWISDGTSANTSEWANLSLGPTSSDPQLPTFVGTRLFFTGYSNGTPAIFSTTWDAPIPDAGIVIPPNTSSSSSGSTSSSGGSTSSSTGGPSSSSSSSSGATATSGSTTTDGGSNATPAGGSDDSGGCGCRTTSQRTWSGDAMMLALTVLALRRRRR